MYVIFPADELIRMTYGAAVPKFQPRPTLDNLREPAISIGHRPLIPSPLPTDFQPTTPTTYRERTPSYIESLENDEPDDIFSERPPSVLSSRLSDSGRKLTAANPATAAKTKSKSKLHLHIPIGRSNKPTTPETARLRDSTEIRISNPTFTHENLRQRNYDAFFESGEPVYSLEKRAPPQPTPEPEPPPSNRPSSSGMLQKVKFSTNALRTRSSDGHESVEVFPKESSKTNSIPNHISSSSSTQSRSLFGWRGSSSQSRIDNMATAISGPSTTTANPTNGILKDCTHPYLNETIKSHNNVTIKLVKTVSDFSDQLSQLYDQHAQSLQHLVSLYRKKNSELRKERPSCHSTLFQAWETFLQEIEADSVSSGDVAAALSKQISRPLLDRTVHRQVQSRKIFTHRESFDTIIGKTEDKLSKCRLDYKQCYVAYRQQPNQHTLTIYIDSHNAYVQQLHATNAMLEAYHCDTIPQLIQELEEIYNDLCTIVSTAVLQSAELFYSKAGDQAKRYENLSIQCRSVSSRQDLTSLARILLPLQATQTSPTTIPKKAYVSPQVPGEIDDTSNPNSEIAGLSFKNELVLDRNNPLEVRSSIDSLKREGIEIELQIRQLQDVIENLLKSQIRGIESQLYTKVNELQEDISMKKFDLRAKQLHLAAVKAQKELFLNKTESVSPRTERKLSGSSSSSMKTKWLKAFRSLKPASGNVPSDRKNGGAAIGGKVFESENHSLIEYTYKKITPCDVCSQVLRGHTRQGLRCRNCKLNVHIDCAPKLPRCQIKQKLLRRQKSTSEIENRIELDEEKPNDIDQIYRVLKLANEISANKANAEKSNQLKEATAISSAGYQPSPEINIITAPDCPPDRQSGGNNADTGTVSGKNKLKPSIQLLQDQAIGGIQTKQNLSALHISDMSSSDVSVKMGSGTNVLTNIGAAGSNQATIDHAVLMRRRLFAGIRQLSGIGRGRLRSTQHRSISLPETPHSPRRQKLNLRMKSLSLDSPESSEIHCQIRRRVPLPGTSALSYGIGATASERSTPPTNNSRLQSPSSPSNQRKLLYAARSLRTGSVDLPDDMEKSYSSDSTSPCPSPIKNQLMKSQRLLPTNLYVILYNFKARHPDELDLKAGYKVTVIDSTDSDWWKGKCLGRIGYFPSKYCARLAAGEKPLQVIQNLQLADSDRSEKPMVLLRDQIVVQIGEEISGAVMVRSADNRQGICPIKFLQEV